MLNSKLGTSELTGQCEARSVSGWRRCRRQAAISACRWKRPGGPSVLEPGLLTQEV